MTTCRPETLPVSVTYLTRVGSEFDRWRLRVRYDIIHYGQKPSQVSAAVDDCSAGRYLEGKPRAAAADS